MLDYPTGTPCHRQCRAACRLSGGRNNLDTIPHIPAEVEKQLRPLDGQPHDGAARTRVPYGVYFPLVSSLPPRESDEIRRGGLDAVLDRAAKICFEHDRSAARGLMSTQKLIVFKHDTALGCKFRARALRARRGHAVDKMKPPAQAS